MTPYQIITILGEICNTFTGSYYMNSGDDGIIRASDHLPKEVHLENNNEETERFFFIFSDCNLTEREVEIYLDEMYFLDDKEYYFVIIEDEADLPYLNMKLKQF